MRFADATLALCAMAALGVGCRKGDAARPGEGASARLPAAVAPASSAVPAPLAPPPTPWRPSVDCDKLLGAERASRVLGRPVVADLSAALPSECRYAPAAAAGAAAGPSAEAALVDVIFACREAAAPIARSVLGRIEAGRPALDIGQKGVALDGEGGRGVVQFLDQGSPCAVEVATLPADKAIAMAREVASTIASVRVTP